MNEQQLASLCKKRDKNALKLIYESYAPWMMGIAMRYTANEEHSKDILHDSFVKIFESMDRFEYQGVGSLKAWLSRIVINTALTQLRTQWPVSGTVGLNLKLSKQFSLFGEPGVVYYFDDKSPINNIRHKRPLNFNLQAGVRFNLK